MTNHIITLSEFILNQEKQFEQATGNFTILLTQLATASKTISAHIKKTGLVDILGKAGSTNTFDEEQQKLDVLSNDILIKVLKESQQVSMIASEELDKPVYTNNGKYMIYLDPLDGSSVIDSNISIGTIFSIYHSDKNILQPGNKQVASGYIIYGPSVMFIYTTGNGVNGFTLDPSIGDFILSHPNMKIPEYNSIYSINEGNFELFPEYIQKYLKDIKTKGYKLRYAGSMVADIHRTLIKGGIFLYPEDTKSKDGKLRLMLEVNAMSFLIEQAGGKAWSKNINPLEIIPEKLTQRTPIVLGSKKNIEEFIKFCSKNLDNRYN